MRPKDRSSRSASADAGGPVPPISMAAGETMSVAGSCSLACSGHAKALDGRARAALDNGKRTELGPRHRVAHNHRICEENHADGPASSDPSSVARPRGRTTHGAKASSIARRSSCKGRAAEGSAYCSHTGTRSTSPPSDHCGGESHAPLGDDCGGESTPFPCDDLGTHRKRRCLASGSRSADGGEKREASSNVITKRPRELDPIEDPDRHRQRQIHPDEPSSRPRAFLSNAGRMGAMVS